MDLPRLKEIIDLSFPRFFRFFASQSVNSEEGIVLITETQGVILGFAKIIEFNINSRKYGCILWIAVHPSYRRRGIAFSLTNASVNWLKKEGAQAIFASTQRKNNAALATLRKLDFKRMGFLELRRLFSWQVLEFYNDIWFAPNEIVLMYS
jgi:ribosomal protein S18 acetylase RimI-like enzyme